MIDDHSNRLPTISSIITLLISVFHLCSGFTEFIHFFFIHLSCDYYRMIDQGCLIDRWYQMSDWINFDFFFWIIIIVIDNNNNLQYRSRKKIITNLIWFWSDLLHQKRKSEKILRISFITAILFFFSCLHIITRRFCAIFFSYLVHISPLQ